MKHRLWAAFALLVTAGAAPAPNLPIPPIPPADPPADTSAAIPDPDVRAPADLSRPGVHVSVQDFRVDYFNRGLGYTPGSHFQTSEEKRPIQTPGLTLEVPLQLR